MIDVNHKIKESGIKFEPKNFSLNNKKTDLEESIFSCMLGV